MEIDGQCFCGRVKYRARLEEDKVVICHCRDCQIFAGTAFRMSGIVRPADLQWSGEQAKIFAKTADSGAIRHMAFCEECGTHLCSLPADLSDENAYISIRVGTSAQFHELRPMAEIYTASRVPWLEKLDGCIEFEAMPQRAR